MVRTKAELLEALSVFNDGAPTDALLALTEDISDTMDDLENRVSESGDWKSKYDELDKTWRQKYMDRFMTGIDPEDVLSAAEEVIEEVKELTFDALFEEVE